MTSSILSNSLSPNKTRLNIFNFNNTNNNISPIQNTSLRNNSSTSLQRTTSNNSSHNNTHSHSHSHSHNHNHNHNHSYNPNLNPNFNHNNTLNPHTHNHTHHRKNVSSLTSKLSVNTHNNLSNEKNINMNHDDITSIKSDQSSISNDSFSNNIISFSPAKRISSISSNHSINTSPNHIPNPNNNIFLPQNFKKSPVSTNIRKCRTNSIKTSSARNSYLFSDLNNSHFFNPNTATDQSFDSSLIFERNVQKENDLPLLAKAVSQSSNYNNSIAFNSKNNSPTNTTDNDNNNNDNNNTNVNSFGSNYTSNTTNPNISSQKNHHSVLDLTSYQHTAEDFIPPVLDATTSILTDENMDLDKVEIISSNRRPSTVLNSTIKNSKPSNMKRGNSFYFPPPHRSPSQTFHRTSSFTYFTKLNHQGSQYNNNPNFEKEKDKPKDNDKQQLSFYSYADMVSNDQTPLPSKNRNDYFSFTPVSAPDHFLNFNHYSSNPHNSHNTSPTSASASLFPSSASIHSSRRPSISMALQSSFLNSSASNNYNYISNNNSSPLTSPISLSSNTKRNIHSLHNHNLSSALENGSANETISLLQPPPKSSISNTPLTHLNYPNSNNNNTKNNSAFYENPNIVSNIALNNPSASPNSKLGANSPSSPSSIKSYQSIGSRSRSNSYITHHVSPTISNAFISRPKRNNSYIEELNTKASFIRRMSHLDTLALKEEQPSLKETLLGTGSQAKFSVSSGDENEEDDEFNNDYENFEDVVNDITDNYNSHNNIATNFDNINTFQNDSHENELNICSVNDTLKRNTSQILRGSF
ncbi:uncharacterized protein ASCRUDRAFT_75354 [Ascoidea rubescens DSM 1968]|uniref:Uncharacterized protein n=1 Tax=Ascoidea rubescens DSM 1968 TaxID=1344418 RepID=A0A1D2VI45_9ASCO|nr:hypothetical protein ASCRUDRAFT_75354 [Ascoidea rubescens DSM 1968]ODV61324.1 hypothetical protein ASCRUDRAFT_75354 [Ascoidea rubescens DSM 1968]